MKRLFFAALLLATLCAAQGKDFVFAGYNVQNYAPLPLPGETKTGKPLKTKEAAAAVISVIKEIGPDILGVCEMGSRQQFEEFRERLKEAGLGYVDAEFVEAADPARHLALVSRFPIVARQSITDLSYEANGLREKARRGFLDVTVQVNEHYRLRILGAHLKSKFFTAEGDALQRRNEAHLLRAHIDKILEADPKADLLVFGDFNDSKDQPPLQEIKGVRGTPQQLATLPLADSVGDHWTHYWKTEDSYSRIDYLFVNRPLAPKIIRSQSYVYRSLLWNLASDHRPLVATIRPPN